MTLNDLKNLDILTLRNGKQFFVYKDLFINIKENSYILYKNSYNSKLLNDSYTERDIMKVERLDCEIRCLYLDVAIKRYLEKTGCFIYKTVYQRIETTELTMQQIADKFEIPVETLKIKK